MSAVNPKIVCVHLSAYGRNNERASWPGYDYLMQAESGLMHLTGEPDGPPARLGAPSIIDQTTGLTAAVGLLSAIIQARSTGKGCDVDTCLLDVALHQLGYAATWYLNEGHVSTRQRRSAHYSVAPVQTFPTADGWLFIMCMTDKFWNEFVGAIGRPDLLSDPRFATMTTRQTNRDALTEIIDGELGKQPTRLLARQVQRRAAGRAGTRSGAGARQSLPQDHRNDQRHCAPGQTRDAGAVEPDQDQRAAPQPGALLGIRRRQRGLCRQRYVRPNARVLHEARGHPRHRPLGVPAGSLSDPRDGRSRRRGHQDRSRRAKAIPGRHIGLSDGPSTVFFRNLNRGKKSVVLDLKDNAQRDTLLTLCETADVFVESFRPGAVDRLGVGYEAVRARNPRIVYCSISAFGQDGELRGRPAHDLALEAEERTAQHDAGQRRQAGHAGHSRRRHARRACKGLSGVLMALLRREQTGLGDYIDISMHDVTVGGMLNILGPAFAENRQPVPAHERTTGGAAFYRPYETQRWPLPRPGWAGAEVHS